MSKSIYEEAIGQLLKIQGRLSTDYDKFLEVKQALEQAQKQEQLLELYKQLNKLYQELYTIELSQLVLNQNYYEIEIIKLKQQIKELENDNT